MYLTETVDAVIWGAELARGDAKERIYIVKPTGDFEDDPNVTDKKFKGNPTKSYRTKQPLKIHSPEVLQAMLDNLKKLEKVGIKAIE